MCGMGTNTEWTSVARELAPDAPLPVAGRRPGAELRAQEELL